MPWTALRMRSAKRRRAQFSSGIYARSPGSRSKCHAGILILTYLLPQQFSSERYAHRTGVTWRPLASIVCDLKPVFIWPYKSPTILCRTLRSCDNISQRCQMGNVNVVNVTNITEASKQSHLGGKLSYTNLNQDNK